MKVGAIHCPCIELFAGNDVVNMGVQMRLLALYAKDAALHIAIASHKEAALCLFVLLRVGVPVHSTGFALLGILLFFVHGKHEDSTFTRNIQAPFFRP